MKSLITNILKSNNKLYNDINNIIISYIPREDNLFDLYNKFLIDFGYNLSTHEQVSKEQENLFEYFHVLQELICYLLKNGISIGDTDNNIKDYLENYNNFIFDILKKKIDSNLSITQVEFLEYYLIPFLLTKKDIFSSILFETNSIHLYYENICFEIDDDNESYEIFDGNEPFEIKKKYYITFVDIIKCYTKIVLKYDKNIIKDICTDPSLYDDKLVVEINSINEM